MRSSRLSKRLRTRLTLTITAEAIHNFYKDTGRWPESFDALQKNEKGVVYIDWGGYPQQDAWGRKIIYNRFDPVRGYGSVASYGPNSKLGSNGVATDLEVRFGMDFPTWEQIQTNAPGQQGEANGR